MLLRLIVCFGVVLFGAGCGERHPKGAPVQENGQVNSKVAIMAATNSSSFECPWGIGKELTAGVKQRLIQDGKIYIAASSDNESAAKLEAAAPKNESDAIAKAGDSKFVVLMEILDHKEVPYQWQKLKPLYTTAGTPKSVLMITMRLKVLDLRQSTPRVVLQEIVHSNHLISKNARSVDYTEISWGSPGYLSTPIGVAHARLAKDVAARVEHYVAMASTYQ